MCLSITARWKNCTKLKCPSTGEWINKLWYSYMTECSRQQLQCMNWYICIKYFKIMLNEKSKFCRRRHIVYHLYLILKPAKWYNKMISYMSIFSKIISACIVLKTLLLTWIQKNYEMDYTKRKVAFQRELDELRNKCIQQSM